MNSIPQIISIVSMSRDGDLNLTKTVIEYLGVERAQDLFQNMKDEIALSAEQGDGDKVTVLGKNAIHLPEEAVRKLEINDKSLVGLVQRRGAVVIKKVEIVEREGERARITDLETTYKIIRLAETNPLPEKLLPKLRERYKSFKLRFSVFNFLRGRRTYEAWRAREILGIAEPSDEELRKELTRERLGKQWEDGSWEGRVTVTAKSLLELAELGMKADADEIVRAIKWLMERPQSPWHAGMFFVTDEQVKTRKLTIKKPMDDLMGFPPCGLRMMWPTSLALEALSRLNSEGNERVQSAVRTLMSDKLCEAHRLNASWQRPCDVAKEPYSMEDVEEMEKDCFSQFKYGGMSGIKDLETNDLTHKGGTKMPRVGHRLADGVDEYPLKIPRNLHGCGWRATRALSGIRDEKARRLGEAQLWRLAGRQHSADGAFVGKGNEKYLGFFARHDHPVAKVVIFRSIPWILENQNEDGSWGSELNKDRATLAVIEALKRVELICT